MADFLLIQTQTGWGKVLETFAGWCQPQAGWQTLDIGCGPGLLPALLARRGCLAYGIDLDAAMLRPHRLHGPLVQADALRLPFPEGWFHLVTASNLLFTLPDPKAALVEMRRLLQPTGQVALLNPSERLNMAAALSISERRGLQGVARDSLINWARIAEAGRRWHEDELSELFTSAGMKLTEAALMVGPGFARFTRGIRLQQ